MVLVPMEEVAEASSAPPRQLSQPRSGRIAGEERVRVRRRTLEAVLEQCQRALELLTDADLDPDPEPPDAGGDGEERASPATEKPEEEEKESPSQPPIRVDYETDELCELLKSKVESTNFLERLGNIHMSVSQNIHDDNSSWDMVCATDLWEDVHIDGDNESDQDGYVLVKEEDIVEGIACFMATYLLSLKQTKDLTPNQLQEALSRTFSVKRKKSQLRKAWEGSKVIYDVASWSATAIGIYQNPAILKAASVAFWSSCRVLSKFF